jgi:hypothetical protein
MNTDYTDKIQKGAVVKFERPGSIDTCTRWTGVVEEILPDGNLSVRDNQRKLRIVPADSKWLSEEKVDANQKSSPPGDCY